MNSNEIMITFEPDPLSGAMVHLSPLAQFECIAGIVVSVAVVWLAIRNLRTLYQGPTTAGAIKAVDCRMAISQYMLIFLFAVWLLALATSLQFIILNVLLSEGEPMSAARTMMTRMNSQPPVTIAYLLAALTAIHGSIGTVFALRKRSMKE